MKTPPENKVLESHANKTMAVCVRLLSDDAMEGKQTGDIVYVDVATAERLIAGYFAELAEE